MKNLVKQSSQAMQLSKGAMRTDIPSHPSSVFDYEVFLLSFEAVNIGIHKNETRGIYNH